MEKICKNCEWWEGTSNWKDAGECENENHIILKSALDDVPKKGIDNKMVIRPYKGVPFIFTGPNFGCVQFEKRQ